MKKFLLSIFQKNNNKNNLKNVVNQQYQQQTLYNGFLPDENQCYRPTKLIVDLQKIRNNVKKSIQQIKEQHNPDGKLLAVVKANCYGLGAINIVPEIIAAGASSVGIAVLDEGIQLRKAGISTFPILHMSLWQYECAPIFFKYNITPTLYSLKHIEILNKTAQQLNVTINVHIKIDTGMGRVGFLPNQFRELISDEDNFKKLFSNLKVEGFMTHMASSDEYNEIEYTNKQQIMFKKLTDQFLQFLVEKIGYPQDYKLQIHCGNSGVTTFKNQQHFTGNLYRVGDVLYGGHRGEYPKDYYKWNFEPACDWVSEISDIKYLEKGSNVSYNRKFKTEKEETKIALIPVGYADGLPIGLSNKGVFIVKNKHGKIFNCPIRGKVCMDVLMIEVTDVEDVEIGDKVYLIGEGKTQEQLFKEGTGVEYFSFTTQIGQRVPRVYINRST